MASMNHHDRKKCKTTFDAKRRCRSISKKLLKIKLCQRGYTGKTINFFKHFSIGLSMGVHKNNKIKEFVKIFFFPAVYLKSHQGFFHYSKTKFLLQMGCNKLLFTFSFTFTANGITV